MKWSAIEDTQLLAQEVVEYAAVLRGVDKLNNGDIVIAKLPLSGKFSSVLIAVGVLITLSIIDQSMTKKCIRYCIQTKQKYRKARWFMEDLRAREEEIQLASI